MPIQNYGPEHPALPRVDGAIVHASLSTTSTVATALPTGAIVIQVALTGDDAYVIFGDSGVGAAAADATSRLIVAGEKLMPVPLMANGSPATHFRARTVSGTGAIQLQRVDA